MNVLLTGGAGYIGSHAARALARAGHEVTVYDSLVRGHAPAVKEHRFIEGDMADAALLRSVLGEYGIDTVIHFAAYIEVGESIKDPAAFYRNNTMNALTLLEAMRDGGVGRIVFSSTAAVYGLPERVPIDETQRLAPINPYGASKLCTEYMLAGFAASHGLAAAALRYFNVAGAHPDGDIGEDHHPESHLIPLTLQVALGQRDKVFIFGDDYDTPDGTCIRDYIHVCDLVDAHLLAAEKLTPGRLEVYNLGNGAGFSVKQVIDMCREVSGHAIPAERAPRRGGDPDSLIASSRKASDQLGWTRTYGDLRTIVQHAWAWHRHHPHGYGER